jgi:hypothetical protein
MVTLEESAMRRSLSDLVLQQRQRIDVLAQTAGRFLDAQAEQNLRRLSARLDRIAATLALPGSQSADPAGRLQAQLERFVRELHALQIDDQESIARTAWAIADLEETLRHAPMPVMRAVYVSN